MVKALHGSPTCVRLPASIHLVTQEVSSENGLVGSEMVSLSLKGLSEFCTSVNNHPSQSPKLSLCGNIETSVYKFKSRNIYHVGLADCKSYLSKG